MSIEAGFEQLLAHVRDGQEEAVVRLVSDYSRHLRRVIRRRLSSRLRSKVDSTDFEQSVWATFFKHRAELPDFQSPQHLINYLAQIAEHKVIDEHRRLHTLQNNVERETAPGSDLAALGGSDFRPSEYVRAEDLWERMLNGVPENQRRVLELRRTGATHLEIAGVLKIDPKTVQRWLRRIERDYAP